MRAVLISGIPATGKTCFGNWLARYHGFRHVDLESDPDRPDPFAMEPLAFIDQTRAGESDLVACDEDWRRILSQSLVLLLWAGHNGSGSSCHLWLVSQARSAVGWFGSCLRS